MADAYSTIVQQTLAKKQEEAQSRANVAQSNTNAIKSIYSSVMSLGDTTAKLVKSAIDTAKAEEARVVQNKYNDAEAEGVFDRVDIHDENSGVEADPEKTYQNRLTWLDEELSNPDNKYRFTGSLKKSFTQYIEGKRASIIESKNTQNYNTVQSGISSSIDYMNSAYYNPEDSGNDIDFAVSTAFADDGYNTVADTVNVQAYGLGTVAQNWLAEKAKYDNGEENDFEKVDYEFRYTLGAYSAGESEYSFRQRKDASFDSDYLSYQVGQWARAEGEIVKSGYLESGCDSSYLTSYFTNLTSRVNNEGLQVDRNGKATTIERAQLGTSGLATALQIAQNYASALCAQVASEQSEAWNTAVDTYTKDYGSFGSYFDFTSEDEYIDYLVKASGGKLNRNYAKNNISEDAKTQIRVNKRNSDVGTLYGIIINPTSTEEDKNSAIREVFSQGLTDLFSSDSGLGLGDLYDSSDDNMQASVRVALNKITANGMAYGDAFRELMQGTDIDTYKKVFASQSTDTVYASDSEEAYKYNLGVEDFIDKSIQSLAGDSSVTFNDSDKKAYKELYAVKDDIENNDLVKQYLAKEDTTEDEKKAVWNAYYYKNYSDSTTTINAANSVIESIETQMQNENDINTVISSIKPIVLTGKDDGTAWDYIVDNNLIDFVTGDNGLGVGDFRNGGKVNATAVFREYVSNYADEHGLSFEEAYEPAMKEALEGYSLSDLQTTSDTAKSGYMKVNSPVYNFQMKRSYERTYAAEGLEDALVSAIATGDESSVNDLFNKYGTSWEDYSAYKAIYATIKEDGLLQSAFKEIDGKNLSEEEKNSAKASLAQGIFDAEVKLLTGTEEEEKEAKTYLNNIRGNAYYNNAKSVIDLGFVLLNTYSDSNKDGYSDVFQNTYSESKLLDLIGKDAAETKSNVDDLINLLENMGMDLTDFKKEWGEVSYEDGYIDSMTESQLLAVFEPLKAPMGQYASAAYGSFKANYGDVTSSENGYVGMKIEDVITEKYDKLSDDLDQELLSGLVANGTISYGEDYQGMKWSKDMYNAGGKGTQAWNNVVAFLIAASDETERQKILKEAEKVLNPEALKELDGVGSVNLMIHTIDEFKDYDFFQSVVDSIGKDSTFYPLASKSTLSDWNECLADSSYLNSAIADAVRNYTDPVSFEKTLNELAGQIRNTYLLQVDKSSRETYNQSFVTQDFDPFTAITEDLGDEKATNANIFFDSWSEQRDYYNETVDTNDYNTQLLVYNYWNGGKTKSELSQSITAKLSDPDIDEGLIMPYTAVLVLDQMGYSVNGITSESFEGEDKDNAIVRLYNNLQTLQKNAPEVYSKLLSSATAIDKSFEEVRNFNSLGYDNNYTYNIDGLQIDGYTKVERNNGELIAYDKNGNSTNLTMYTDNGSVKLKDRAQYIAGDYYISTNAFGTKITVSSDAITTREGIKQFSDYNTAKSKAHNVSDYSKASEFVITYYEGDLRDDGTPSNTIAVELTGNEIANNYIQLLYQGNSQRANEYISTLSDGMKNFVMTSVDEQLALQAYARTADKEAIGNAQYLFATNGPIGQKFSLTLKTNKNIPDYDGEFKKLCEDALDRVLQRYGSSLYSKKPFGPGALRAKTLVRV